MASPPPSPSLCWVSMLNPHTLVNVGTEAVAMGIGNTICLTNNKTKDKIFHKTDTPPLGAGASVLIGHKRFPLFAYSEAVLRPMIHVLKYPDISKFGTYTAKGITSFIDLCFSEFEHIVAIAGYPDYVICVWNIRTGDLMVQQSTDIRCGLHSLACSFNNLPSIMQFSDVTKEIHIWELCFKNDVFTLSEISRIRLEHGYEQSSEFNACFAEDGDLYVVNDYGTLCNVEMNDFYLRKAWSTPSSNNAKATAHYVYFHKLGLMVANKETLYFIKKKSYFWNLDWTMNLLTENISHFVSNYNNEIYCANYVGNLYRVDVGIGVVTLTQCWGNNCKVRDFALLKGIKDEVVLMHDSNDALRLVNILTYNLISEFFVEDSLCLFAHNSFPFVAVGTNKGQIHFVSYEKLRAPAIVGSINAESTPLRTIRMQDTSGLARDINNRLHMLHIDFRHNYFSNRASIDIGNVKVLNFFMVDESNILLFVTKENKDTVVLCANELWAINWNREMRNTVTRSEFILPYKYRSVSLGIVESNNHVEIFALRYGTYLIDIFYLNNFSDLVLTTTFEASRFTRLTGISGGRNLITWGVGNCKINFRSHKKSNIPFLVSRPLVTQIVPRIHKDIQECFNLKYLLILRSTGLLKSFRMPSLSDYTRENTFLSVPPVVFKAVRVSTEYARNSVEAVKQFVPTESELMRKEAILKKIRELEIVVKDLINFDISVTHKESGIFGKFCLDSAWVQTFKEQARLLCDYERQSLLKGIADQERIRDWMRRLVTESTSFFATKLRGLFSSVVFENYALGNPQSDDALRMIDYFRFYDMEPIEEESAAPREDRGGEKNEGRMTKDGKKLKRYIQTSNMFEHVLHPIFAVQDKDELMANQMQNAIVQSRIVLTNSLKQEFNKKFKEVHMLKEEMMNNILGTNTTIKKIHDNMNCMLRLLKMESFTPNEPSVPVWKKDEVLDRIMTVDDSEIKAINRRKKKQLETAQKRGRMLVWSIEFWLRALQIMMDGVLEKLWEEEIKKDIPIPEFMLKKQDHEYTVEEQKQFREYHEKLRLLAEDRRKYLRILHENERKTLALKKNFIMKINAKCTEMATLKLKYDFAIKQEEMRINTLKMFHSKRILWRDHMQLLRKDVEKLSDYIEKYTHLFQFWEKSVGEMKEKIEAMTTREKVLEKQFKTNYMTLVPHLAAELYKMYKRRPKSTQKSFASSLVCSEIAAKIVHKTDAFELPLPTECYEFLTSLDAMDEPQNMPDHMEPKHWETFTKLRRQKMEIELKVKAIGYEIIDFQRSANSFVKEVGNLKTIRGDTYNKMDAAASEYFEILQNRNLQITLNLGQVEINIGSSFQGLKESILMNVSDINEVNDLIKTAGEKKLKGMQRVAVFRRKVLYKEWEHKVIRANIDYLKYMLEIIEKCKVTIEFLQILRNWKNIKEAKQASSNVGIIERAIEVKVAAYRRNLDKVIQNIEIVRGKIEEIKKKNQQVNKSIDDFKINVALANVKRDFLAEERRTREQNERMAKIKTHARLLDTVRADYVHILELSTILEIQRLRTYPTLPAVNDPDDETMC